MFLLNIPIFWLPNYEYKIISFKFDKTAISIIKFKVVENQPQETNNENKLGWTDVVNLMQQNPL